MGANGDGVYSTLEAIPQQNVHQTYRQEKPLPIDLGKQFAPDDGKQPVHQTYRQEKALPIDLGKQVVPDEGKQYMLSICDDEVVEKQDFYARDFNGHHVQAHRSSRSKWILFGGTVGLIAILAAVLGGVFGSRHRSRAAAPLASPSNSSATSLSVTPTQRNIAALSFASNSVNNTRVYFQDKVGQITEAASSAENTTWSINRTGVRGKNGSAIAAAVSRPGFPLVDYVSAMSIQSS